jgi:hypothetical protein
MKGEENDTTGTWIQVNGAHVRRHEERYRMSPVKRRSVW